MIKIVKNEHHHPSLLMACFDVSNIASHLRYRLMRFCWQENPDKRPTFNRLREEIERMLNIKNDSKMAGDTHVELDRCTNYHYMDEMSLARQRSLSTKWSTSSEDAALL